MSRAAARFRPSVLISTADAHLTLKPPNGSAFVEDGAHNPGELVSVVADIAKFLMPHATAAARRGR
jgi:hypothetical protein